MTNLTHFVLITVSIFSVCLASFDTNAFKQKFNTTISAPYKASLGTYANNVLKFLADAPVPKSSEQAGPLVEVLKRNVGQFSTQLEETSKASTNLLSELDRSIESTTAELSTKEEQLKQKNLEVQQAVVNIQSIDQQIVEAQNQVNAAQVSLEQAEAAVKTEETNVDKARNCIIRGKRGFFSDVGKFLKKVVNFPCQVFNSGGIDNAKEGREKARQHQSVSQARLQNLINNKDSLVTQHGQSDEQRVQLKQNEADLRDVLQQLQQEWSSAVDVNTKLKAVVLHLSTLFGKSHILKEAVSTLIDMTIVLNPLEAISTQITNYTGNVDDAQYLNTLKQIMITSANILKEKLPKYPFIEVNLSTKTT